MALPLIPLLIGGAALLGGAKKYADHKRTQQKKSEEEQAKLEAEYSRMNAQEILHAFIRACSDEKIEKAISISRFVDKRNAASKADKAIASPYHSINYLPLLVTSFLNGMKLFHSTFNPEDSSKNEHRQALERLFFKLKSPESTLECILYLDTLVLMQLYGVSVKSEQLEASYLAAETLLTKYNIGWNDVIIAMKPLDEILKQHKCEKEDSKNTIPVDAFWKFVEEAHVVNNLRHNEQEEARLNEEYKDLPFDELVKKYATSLCDINIDAKITEKAIANILNKRSCQREQITDAYWEHDRFSYLTFSFSFKHLTSMRLFMEVFRNDKYSRKQEIANLEKALLEVSALKNSMQLVLCYSFFNIMKKYDIQLVKDRIEEISTRMAAKMLCVRSSDEDEAAVDEEGQTTGYIRKILEAHGADDMFAPPSTRIPEEVFWKLIEDSHTFDSDNAQFS